MEGRDQPRENPGGEARGRTQSRRNPPPNLVRVNAAAHRADQTQFTALLHHVDRAALDARSATEAAGECGSRRITVEMYDKTWRPISKTYTHASTPGATDQNRCVASISASRWRTAPLGVPALEDKIVQSAVAELLSAIYETDFLGFSYGFRPGPNSAHGT